MFALVAAAAAIAALGGFQDNPAAPGIIGGFAAAGAVLLALAIAAGEGIAILPANRMTPIPLGPATRAGDVALAVEPSAALQAIGASHQGVFDLNLRTDIVELSSEAATLIGLKSAQTLRHLAWIDRIHPEDRDTYRAAIGDYRGHPGIAFRIELRVRSERAVSLVRIARDDDRRRPRGRSLPRPDGRRHDAQGSRSGRHRPHDCAMRLPASAIASR